MSAVDPAARSKEQKPVVSRASSSDLPERLWTYDDFKAVEAMPVDYPSRLASLAFIRAAIRRSARFCWVMGLAGLLIGIGAYRAFPPAYQASTTVLVTYGPYENVATAPADEQAIAQSRTVGALAVRNLGLKQSVSSFVAAYTVAPASNRVLLITASAPSSNAAMDRANAVAAAFLKVRARQLQTQQNLVLGSIDQQINQTKQRVQSLTTQIKRLAAQPPSSAQRAKLVHLGAERDQAAGSLSSLQQSVARNPAISSTALAVKGSVVLDHAAPIAHSRLKSLVFYAAVGLILGLALGAGIAAIRALMSDRLRRRDDIAYALGAPVQLSIGTVPRNPRLPGRRGLAAAEDAGIQRIVGHLGSVVAAGAHDPAALAVIPVDESQTAALSLVSLAVSCAGEMGLAVIVSDLCGGAPAARLMGITKPGIQKVSVSDVGLVVAVPDRDDIVPIGPLGNASPQPSSFTAATAEAFASADLLLTLAALDPSLGGEHLATWATTTVAFVTAGKSSATRIHTVGEMIRLAGMRLDSAVLIGADLTDESLGVANTSGSEYQPAESKRACQ